MAIYTLAELDIEIATYKAALTALATAKTTQIGDKRLDRHDIPTMREHLQYLDSQRDQIINSGGVPTRAAGRTYARNAGRG